ncbi:Dehydrocurvularin biosynthesis regulator-like protein [Cladobotryum mycophilum]|uniref:Dehydrocurvularin biosynthesis regulator-like protein n=1 Tax=Cladobotryum mycophilum TaxID=491253 RepID=A0ABR0SJ66_9HYPO
MDESLESIPTKRMRLGTKSCAECRRRKVRCVFAENARICQGCALHQTPCRAQQPRQRPGSGSSSTTDSNALQQRVAELEGMIRRLCDTIAPNENRPSSTSTDLNARTNQLIQHVELQRGQPQERPAWQPDQDSQLLETSPVPLTIDATDTSAGYSDELDNSIDAPLIHLFRDAMLIQENEGELCDDPEDLPATSLLRGSLVPFRPPIPDTDVIRMILEDTQAYWPLWPPYYYGPNASDTIKRTSMKHAEHYICQELMLGRGPSFCKALLWLTLCIQQLPKQWKREIINPSISRLTLMDAYMRFARTLLSLEGEDSLDGLQCFLMLYKLLINMGRPQRAWISIRRAVSSATVLGLHRPGSNADPRRRIIWSQIWQLERQISALIGFPTVISRNVGVGETVYGSAIPLPQQILRRLSIICADVIERNENPENASYGKTVQLDQEMEDIKRLFPAEWWEPHTPDAPLDAIYYQEVSKVQYFLFVKLVHLPYMLKARNDRRYEHSRFSTMEASRELIRGYSRLRGSPKTELVQCELMDFQAFSAGVTLILGILYESTASHTLDHEDDWKLVDVLIVALRLTTSLLECKVTEQGAHVLEVLVAASRGKYSSPTDLSLVVPYFGRLRINGTRTADGSSMPSAAGALPDPLIVDPQLQLMSNTIEFSGNEFLNNTFLNFNFEMELGQDWTDLLDDGASHDWNQTFNNIKFG